MAKAQAARVAALLTKEGGPVAADKEVLAVIAYLQRLGQDIRLAQPEGVAR